MKKRFFSLLLALTVFVSAVTVPYYETKAFDIPTAFWGTLEASRAFWTALNAGGGVRGGGVSLSKFELSSRQDISDFQTQILIGYEAFLYYKNKIKIALENPSLSDSEVQSQAQTQANNQKKSFEDNAIKVNNSTKNITKTDYGYWREYCDSIDYIAKNGLQTPVATSKCKVYVANSLSVTNSLLEISSENTFEYNGHTYPVRGRIDGIWTNLRGDSASRIVPYCICMTQAVTVSGVQKYNYRLYACGISLTGSGQYQYAVTDYYGPYDSISELTSMIQLIVNDSNLPIFVVDRSQYDFFQNNLINNVNLLQLDNNVSTDETYQYKIAIKEALDNTYVGQAIKEGAENGREAIISANSVPVKRSSIKAGEETATGVIGWDIPDARTLEGAIAIPQQQQEVVEGIGVISVPESIVIGGTAENVVEWPVAEDITIPSAIDDSVPISVPITDVISEQAGEFYPSQVDVTEFFPFCIPFDIAYCVSKFHVAVGSAPIIHLPIVYPHALQGVLGESYDVVIDFNEYIALRNVIRYFILLLFIVGLMQVTRNLIRG